MNTTDIRHVGDADVQQITEDAARAACQVLDTMFPGQDTSGISSSFAAHLQEAITQMLAGRKVTTGRTATTLLRQHLLTDATFGNPLIRGEEFLVVRRAGLDPQAVTYEALNDAGTGFVALTDVEHIDPYTSFDAAVKGVLAYLRRPDGLGTPSDYKIAPVGCSETGYILNPSSNHYVVPILSCLTPDQLN